MRKLFFILMFFCLLAVPALQAGEPAIPHPPVATAALDPADRAFLEDLQRRSFDFFWNEANPVNSLGRDRSGGDWCSVAGLGFGFSAICIGVDHGWITRREGCQRILLTLKTLSAAPQGEAPRGLAGNRGWFYHFLERDKPERVDWCEVSTIDTALLFAGAFDASVLFDSQHDPDECQLRQLTDEMFRQIDWQWMTEGQPTLSLSWHPADGFSKCRWKGYNEGMILYILALGTDNHPLPPKFWQEWTKSYRWEKHEGIRCVQFAPLFGHQYSHCWIDFRDITDDYMRKRGITYFENSRRATYAQQAYALRNPRKFPNYGQWEWGFTACNGPKRDGVDGYCARGAPPEKLDDGTIAPTAVAGSIPFAPELCIPTLRQMKQRYPALWGKYGFTDAYNAKVNWVDNQYFAIDQGPIVLMIENYLTGATWRRTMSHPLIQRGLERAGFKPITNE